jgi:hypothetical protein
MKVEETSAAVEELAEKVSSLREQAEQIIFDLDGAIADVEIALEKLAGTI